VEVCDAVPPTVSRAGLRVRENQHDSEAPTDFAEMESGARVRATHGSSSSAGSEGRVLPRW
jgi:hypothetical protein